MTHTFLRDDATGKITPVTDREAMMANLRRENAEAQAAQANPAVAEDRAPAAKPEPKQKAAI